MHNRLQHLRILTVAVLLAACGSVTDVNKPPITIDTPGATDTIAPVLTREMRGVWVATVANIDWPSRQGLTADQQKAELIDILDKSVAAGLNTIVFHVRPAADALYNSALEPWGLMFSGVQGASPGYDPLTFAIDEAHNRGLELHAWVNPFRAGNRSDSLKLASNHVFKTHRDWAIVYGTQLWLDPGNPAARDHSLNVIKDIVTRYDIDGVHLDDYFYPYPETGATFSDSTTYRLYGGSLSLADWRRANIDNFIDKLYTEIHAIKPTVKVGISPFGIWRPGNPSGITGLDSYASIYADSKKWLNNGWLDYFSPQLYWSIASTGQSYPALLDWWIGQNTKNRHIWPGLATYRVNDGTSSAFSSSEIKDQVTLTRTRTGSTGVLLYNATWTLKKNPTAMSTVFDLYKSQALVPASTWLDATPPPAPTVNFGNGSLQITPGSGEAARWWALRLHTSTGGWTTNIVFGSKLSIPISSTIDRAVVQAVDKAGNTSAATTWKR